MQPLFIAATGHYPNCRSIQGNMTDYVFLLEYMLEEGLLLADQIPSGLSGAIMKIFVPP